LCEYCQYQTVCPALAKKALSAARVLGPGLPLPTTMVVESSRPEDIARMLRLAPIFVAWAERVRKDALKLNLETGLEIPGFKRQVRKTDRSVNSVWGAYDAVKDKVSLRDFLSICTGVSIPQLEEFFKKTAKHGEKAKATRNMEARLRDAGVWNAQGEIFYLKEAKK
jgi:hypothetical protein